MKRSGVIGERLASVVVLALEVSEQLDRLDVGVAVDDAAGQRRAHVRERFRSTPYSRHEIRQRRHIDQRSISIRGQARRQSVRAKMMSALKAKTVTNQSASMICTTEFAQRRRGLHDVGGDAAGEVIGEIGDRLAQDIAMRLPADEIGHARRDRLLDDEVMGEARQRTADEDQERHGQKLAGHGS